MNYSKDMRPISRPRPCQHEREPSKSGMRTAALFAIVGAWIFRLFAPPRIGLTVSVRRCPLDKTAAEAQSTLPPRSARCSALAHLQLCMRRISHRVLLRAMLGIIRLILGLIAVSAQVRKRWQISRKRAVRTCLSF